MNQQQMKVLTDEAAERAVARLRGVASLRERLTEEQWQLLVEFFGLIYMEGFTRGAKVLHAEVKKALTS